MHRYLLALKGESGKELELLGRNSATLESRIPYMQHKEVKFRSNLSNNVKRASIKRRIQNAKHTSHPHLYARSTYMVDSGHDKEGAENDYSKCHLPASGKRNNHTNEHLCQKLRKDRMAQNGFYGH